MSEVQVGFRLQKKEVLPRMRHPSPDRLRHVLHVELTKLGGFWMWEPLRETWDYIRDWEEHKREALRKFEEYTRGRGASFVEAEEMPRPPTRWIQ